MFADMYKPHISGVTNCIALHKRRLEELGHEVYVFTFGNRDHHDDEPNVIRSWGLEVGETGYQFGIDYCATAKQLIPTLDVAHVHHPFVSGRLAHKYCEPANVPVVFTNHTRYDLYSDAYAWFLPRKMRLSYLKSYLADFAEEIELVIAPSPGVAEWLRGFGVTSRAVVVPNAIDVRHFASPQNPMSKAALGFPDDSTVLVYLGRVGPEKNIERLVDAFATAAPANPRLHLLVLGDGPARHDLEKAISRRDLADRVNFAGKTPYPQVPDYLAACDMFATASISEVHPLVILEAMAAGLPAIGVKSPGVSDTIQDGVTGFLVADEVSALADRIGMVACDPELRSRLSGGARDAAARYDIRIIAEEMLGLYRDVIAARQQSRARARDASDGVTPYPS